MSPLLRVLAALLLSAPACVAVRGHGGAVVAAGVPVTRLATKDEAVVSALAQPATICGLTAAAYSVGDFDEANSIAVGEGSFGKVLSIPRKTSQGETLTPTEARVLVDGGNRLAVKVAKKVEGKDMALAIKSATREAALGLLVCSDVGCPAGSPFPAFLGTENKGAGEPVALVTELVQGAELASVLGSSPKDTETAAWAEFLDAHALPSPAAAALRNLDGVLAAAAGMALAVARLEEIGAVHHDMKPSNTMIGKGGVRVFDFGLTCLSKDIHEVNKAFISDGDGADGACAKLACTRRNPGGTPSFYSPTKKGFLGPCVKSLQCTAEELRGMDLFAVGMSLMELLAANDLVAYPDYVLAPEDDTCVKIDGTDDEKKEKRAKLASGLPSLLSAYFSLDGAHRVDWAAAGPAADAAGRRIFSYLATFGQLRNRRNGILGTAPPLSYFSNAPPPEKKLIVPRCFSSEKTSGPSGLFNLQRIKYVEDLFLTLAPASAPTPALRPAPWTVGSAVEEHLLSVPTQSGALKPLLEVVRKLLAFDSRHDGFANALDAVHAIDNVRKRLAEEVPQSLRTDAAMVAFRTKLACLASETDPSKARAQPLAQPQPQMQQQAPALPQAAELLQCRAAAALALEQIAQRDKSQGASPRPNKYDVAMALHNCVRAALAEPPPPALLSKRAFGAIVGRQVCAVAQLGDPAVGGAAPPPAEPLVNQNGLAIATEKLPFALEERVSATWAKRLFSLQCDVIGALDKPAGEGVWLHWAGGVSGMGYVEEVHDTSTPGVNPAPYTCRRHYVSSVTGAACKALRLRHATPRSGGGNTRPREGLLKLYAAGNNNAGAFRDAIDRVKTSRCGAGSAADNFRRLLAAATNLQQPQGWQDEWKATAATALAARTRQAQAVSLQGFNNMGITGRRF